MEAGVITGTVKGESRTEAEAGGAGGKYDSRKFKFIEKINYAELRDFVVFLEAPGARTNRLVPDRRKVLTQRDAVFRPHVLPVVRGTAVEWPNEDEIFHNVFSMSEPKQFDLGLYKGNPTNKVVTFDKAGRVDVFCSIHSAMHCIVLVLENPHFAVADSRGRYTIREVPAGTYTIKAWHERLPVQTREITVPEEGEAKADFVLGVRGLPQY